MAERRLFGPQGWFFFAVLIVVQYLAFAHYAQREIVWSYPTFSDPIHYSQQSYDTFEQMLSHGPVHGLLFGLRLPLAQGSLIHVEAAALYLVLGPPRLSALTVNFIGYAGLQFSFVYSVLWLTNRWAPRSSLWACCLRPPRRFRWPAACTISASCACTGFSFASPYDPGSSCWRAGRRLRLRLRPC